MKNIENGIAAPLEDSPAKPSSAADNAELPSESVDPEPLTPLDAYGCFYRENIASFIDDHPSRHPIILWRFRWGLYLDSHAHVYSVGFTGRFGKESSFSIVCHYWLEMGNYGLGRAEGVHHGVFGLEKEKVCTVHCSWCIALRNIRATVCSSSNQLFAVCIDNLFFYH